MRGHTALLCGEFGLLLATLAVVHHAVPASTRGRLCPALRGCGTIGAVDVPRHGAPARALAPGGGRGGPVRVVAAALLSLTRPGPSVSGGSRTTSSSAWASSPSSFSARPSSRWPSPSATRRLPGSTCLLIFEFVLVFALFTAYFEDIPAAGLHQRRLAAWAVAHLVAQVGVAGTGVGASKLVDLHASARLPDTEILKLMVPLAMVFLALAVVGACTRRRPWRPLATARVAAAVAAIVVGALCWVIPFVHVAEALPLYCAVAVLNAVGVVRLRSRTTVVPADAI